MGWSRRVGSRPASADHERCGGGIEESPAPPRSTRAGRGASDRGPEREFAPAPRAATCCEPAPIGSVLPARGARGRRGLVEWSRTGGVAARRAVDVAPLGTGSAQGRAPRARSEAAVPLTLPGVRLPTALRLLAGPVPGLLLVLGAALANFGVHGGSSTRPVEPRSVAAARNPTTANLARRGSSGARRELARGSERSLRVGSPATEVRRPRPSGQTSPPRSRNDHASPLAWPCSNQRASRAPCFTTARSPAIRSTG